MKPLKVFFALLAICAILFLIGQAVAVDAPPTYVQSPDRLNSITAEVELGPRGGLTSFVAIARCSARVTNVDDPGDSSIKVVRPEGVPIDFVKHGNKMILVDGELYTYHEIAKAYSAICQHEWFSKYPPVFSSTKRHLREPLMIRALQRTSEAPPPDQRPAPPPSGIIP